MKTTIITGFLIASIFFISSVAYEQMFYTAAGSEAVENNGKEWINKELPPAIIFFSDNSGQAELKANISSIVEKTANPDTVFQTERENFADFEMNLDKRQIAEELYSGKVFTVTGFLTINGIRIKVPAQYLLGPSGDIENGFTISLIIPVNPRDFNIRIAGEAQSTPILLKVNSGILDEI